MDDRKLEGPLQGLKVIECAHWWVGPVAACILGDLGAEVIKVEQPEGDATRGISNQGEFSGDIEAHSLYFEQANRNKRGIALDLHKEEGRKIIYELVDQADVFITNFRSKALEKLRIDYETLSRLNPRLIYGNATGWGSLGPMAQEPALEFTALARSGANYVVGEEDAVPARYATTLGDQLGAWVLAQGILAALHARERLGVGQKVDVSLFGSLISWLAVPIFSASITGEERFRRSRKDYRNPLANFYKCADDKWIFLGLAQADKHWHDFCEVMGIGRLENDSRFKNYAVRRHNAEEFISILDELFATKPRDEWMTLLRERGELICAPCQSPSEVLNDPQALANDYITEIEHPAWGKVKAVGIPYTFSRTPGRLRKISPALGEDTEAILLEFGYSREDMISLKEKKVI